MKLETRSSSVGWAVILLLADCAGAYALHYLEGWGVVPILLGMVFMFAGAVVILVDWWEWRREDFKLLMQRSDPRVEIMRQYAQLTPDQQANLHASRLIVETVLNLEGAVYLLAIPGAVRKYAWDDVEAIWGAADDERFPPVSTWPDGTIRRELAIELARYWVAVGLLRPAAGNQPARWLAGGYDKARKALWGE